ncbi:ComEA family DNA-binding protein [Saccharothrix variisporea]|uniref:Competence protein ComEA n=1 Tax=Saccharothrix variisporea TaxID=543527 RepID=A0A495X7X7_9PSEU|nr:ComEA family DNA-binding protein [Saccharothrix variisporea]RKT70057.1 competence protein ComEA [Saccharothrix variisporea]
MFENRSETATARLQALIAKSQGKHRAREEPLVVFTSSSGVDPQGGLRALLHRLPVAPVPRRRMIFVGLALGVLLAIALSLWWERPEPEAPPPLPMAAAEVTRLPEEIVVNVVGAVPRPGLVTVPSGARVADAVMAAGGAHPGTDLQGLNLARKVADGEQIAVGIPPQHPDTTVEPVNLNTATKEQLDQLPGVGPVTAQRIVERRLKRGPFTSIDQLGEIEGIGDAKLAKLGDLVRL